MDEVFQKLEEDDQLLRLDPDVWPTKYRCATINQQELEIMRRIGDIVRLGRVQRIRPDEIELEKGSVSVREKTLYADCTAAYEALEVSMRRRIDKLNAIHSPSWIGRSAEAVRSGTAEYL